MIVEWVRALSGGRAVCQVSFRVSGEQLVQSWRKGVLERSDCSQSHSDCLRVGASVYVPLSNVLASFFLSSFSRGPMRVHEKGREKDMKQ